jgi:hypothetical protein
MELGPVSSARMRGMADRLRARRDAWRVEHLDEENERLRAELRMTRSSLERERDRQQEVLDALKRASERKTDVTVKPRRGLLRLLVVGGAAYVFGTKAGRERYEQIKSWISGLKERLPETEADKAWEARAEPERSVPSRS